MTLNKNTKFSAMLNDKNNKKELSKGQWAAVNKIKEELLKEYLETNNPVAYIIEKLQEEMGRGWDKL